MLTTLKKEWWKVVLIVIACGFINMVLHAVLSPLNSSNVSLMKPSFFVQNGLLVPAVIGWELIAFSMLSLIFILIQNNPPGKRRTKGFLYGLSFGGLYLIGMFESVLLLNSSVLNEFLMGLADFVSILLAGMLLGIFIGTDEIKDTKRKNVLPVFVIAVFYIIGRYFAYSILHIQSAYMTKPMGTLIWTLCQGLWVGTIYYILQPGVNGKSVLSKGLFFGIVIFGSNWLMNHLFIAVVAEWTPDLLIRAGADILFAVIGVCTYNSWKVAKQSA